MKRINLQLRDYDEENLAVALMLNPSIANQTDLLRMALENIIESSSSLEQIARARREYRKQKAQAQS